jgi:hypothetical protein
VQMETYCGQLTAEQCLQQMQKQYPGCVPASGPGATCPPNGWTAVQMETYCGQLTAEQCLQQMQKQYPGCVPASGPGPCPAGFVLREAYAGDRICVSPGVREQTITDNSAAPSHTNPEGLCTQGYVWRRAIPSDHVCVTPASRAQAQSDNRTGVQIQGTVQQQVAPPPAGFTPPRGTGQSGATTTPVGAAKATTLTPPKKTVRPPRPKITVRPPRPKITVRPPKLNIAKPRRR